LQFTAPGIQVGCCGGGTTVGVAVDEGLGSVGDGVGDGVDAEVAMGVGEEVSAGSADAVAVGGGKASACAVRVADTWLALIALLAHAGRKDTGLWTTPPLVALQVARPLTGSSREPPRNR
jgi:hypothetical protein